MANFNLNKVILGGRLTSDPELKTTPSGVSVATFTIAVNRRSSGEKEQQADYITVTAWRQTAEFITRFFRKGSSICIVGSIQTRNWTDPQGNKRYATDVVVDEAMFVDAKGESQAAPMRQTVPQQNTAPSYMPDAYSAPKFEDITEGEELPF